MSFNGWGKETDISGNTVVDGYMNARVLTSNKNTSNIDHYGIFECSNYDTYISHTRKSDGHQAILGITYPNSALSINDANAFIKTYIDGNWSSPYNLYGEHNWGKGLSGFAGVDNNATTNTQYAGYYKFATLGQRSNNYSRTSAMFYLLGEDVQYRPSFLYITSRLNVPNTTTSGYNLMQITTYTNSFGGDTIDTNLASRIYICANKPTSVTDNVNVDLYWYQDATYNSLRYYLLHGSYRNGNNKLDMSKITLYSTPTSTSLPTTTTTPSYDYVWKLSDNLNKILNVQY